MGIDFIDIPELHRKKLIKLPPKESFDTPNITKDGFFDLSKSTDSVRNNQNEVKQEQSSGISNFLNDFATIGANEPQKTTEVKQEENRDVKDLKWRLENLEFKLDQLIERVNSLNQGNL